MCERTIENPFSSCHPLGHPPSSSSTEEQDECVSRWTASGNALDMSGTLMYPRSPFLECLFVRDLSLICVRSKGRIRVLVPSNGILCARACATVGRNTCAPVYSVSRIHVQSLVTRDSQPGVRKIATVASPPPKMYSCGYLLPRLYLRPKRARREGYEMEVVRNLTSQFAARFCGADKRMIDISRVHTRACVCPWVCVFNRVSRKRARIGR